ncbi:hypothetical protein NQ318_007826, partial [Aromia moschata]
MKELFKDKLPKIQGNFRLLLSMLGHLLIIKKLHQVGLIHKWLQNYLPRRDRCWKNRHIIEVNNHTVNMDDMQGSFFVLFL